jgi:hypothetical protein
MHPVLLDERSKIALKGATVMDESSRRLAIGRPPFVLEMPVQPKNGRPARGTPSRMSARLPACIAVSVLDQFLTAGSPRPSFRSTLNGRARFLKLAPRSVSFSPLSAGLVPYELLS